MKRGLEWFERGFGGFEGIFGGLAKTFTVRRWFLEAIFEVKWR
jgi:hypothetical protein